MKNVCNRILIGLLILFFGIKVYALNVIYPTSSTMNTNSSSTFFVGNTDPEDDLYINNFKVDVHKSGAFAQKVPLEIGKNIFTLKTSLGEKKYIINRKAVLGVTYSNSNSMASFKPYKEIKYFYVKKDGTALRSTPVESGINRLSHLEKNVILRVDGEIYGLYRVKLTDNNFAWVNKNAVYEKSADEIIEPAKILAQYFDQSKNSYFYKFTIDKRIPYYIEEGKPLVLHLFNTDGKETVLPLKMNYDLMGYDAYYRNSYLILEVKKKLKLYRFRPLKDITIVIDAGHGGAERGAISCLGNDEKDINLKIALFLFEELSKKGADIYMTRFTDEFVSLDDRVKYAHDKKADIFISIHANSLPDGKDPKTSRGSSIYYYYDEAKPLAESILNNMVEKLKVNNDGIYQRSFAVVRNSRALSVLVETGYVINPEDNVLLNNERFQKNCAKAIAKGVLEYLKNSQEK